MSKLAELLNPFPSSQRSPPQPLVLDGEDHRSAGHRSSFDGHSTNSLASLTSPGLEALAAVASNTAPILSPAQSSNSGAAYPGGSNGHYGSRPGSSHTLPPPLGGGGDFAQGGNQGFIHASGLEQYQHHPSNGNGERKMSDETDHSAILPPLVQESVRNGGEFTIEHAPGATVRDDLVRYANGDISEQSVFSWSQDHHLTQNREPYENSHAPATSQIRQPSPGPSDLISSSTLPTNQSDQVEIKSEVQENSEETPQQYNDLAVEGSTIAFDQSSNTGTPALKSITDIKKDASKTPTPTPADSTTMKPKSGPGKKRGAPKKGPGSAAKPPAKKRKIESESVDDTPPAQHAGIPATNRASQTPAPKNRKQDSETPARSSPLLNDEEDDDASTDNGELFCLCRKPDDHTLMIACDGPCNGWFHGRCVDMDAEKTKLISKWYCPSCAELGNETLWRRMCRLEGCAEPARDGSEGKVRSKYCSDAHGAEFMRNLVFGKGSADQQEGPATTKKRKRNYYSDDLINTEEFSDDDHGHLGGVLKPSELKALVDGSKDLETFRKLGDGVLSPPATASPEGEDVKMEEARFEKPQPTYTPEETAQLESITQKKDRCRARRKLLDDRDKLIVLITTRAKNVLAEMKEQDKSVSNICGYDSRLTWSEDEFNEWRASPEGQKALQKDGVLEAPVPMEVGKEREDGGDEGGRDADSVAEKENEKDKEKEEEEVGRGVCKKKRCERHKAWLKLQQQDNLFEKDQARQEMRKLEAEERGVRDRAMVRCLEGLS